MSPKTGGSNPVPQEVATGSLKLPLLNEATGQLMTNDDRSISGQTTARVNISRLSQTDAMSLLTQYNRKVHFGKTQADLPHIKMNIRHDGSRAVPARDRFTTRSLERVERTGRRVFTEGLSSKSKFQEPPLAMHRRDIIGANMPETVRIARERSNIVFGVNRYRSRKQTHGSKKSKGTLKSLHLEPASVTASQIMAPLNIPQKSDFGNVWEDNTKKHDGRIAQMLKTIEEKYGKDVVGTAPSISPSAQSYDYTTTTSSSTTSTTPVASPRNMASVTVKTVRPNLSVVSLGESLQNLPQKRAPTLKLPRKNRDDFYNKLERFRQHVDYSKPRRCELKFTKKMAQNSEPYNPVVGELRQTVTHKVKNKSENRKKRQIIISLKDATGNIEQEDTNPEITNKSPADGKFNVEGIKGVGAGQRLWSPSSVSTSASVVNPPPSVEVGLFDLEIPNVKDTAGILKFGEELVAEDSSRLRTEREAELSDRDSSRVSSSHLSVPSLGSRKEYPPRMEAIWMERPPSKDDPLSGIAGEVSSDAEMKTKTSELVELSENHAGPEISISDSDEVEADLQREKQKEEGVTKSKEGDQAEEEDHVEKVQGDVLVNRDTQRDSLHNQNITFISPLEKQNNAKRH